MNSVRDNVKGPLATVLVLCVAAWGYVAYLSWGMAHMDVGAQMLLMPAMTHWGARDLLLVLLMWTLMMVAMMLPSSLAMIRTFAAVGRQTHPPRAPRETLVFAAGYLAVWTAFSGLATLLQWTLLEARLVSPMMQASGSWLGAMLLVGAGVYQLSPWKARCLARCRSPLVFLSAHWRRGAAGALYMGWRHGLYCLGCCWALMLLLFVLGVMNLAWIVVLALLVLLEKRAPARRWVTQASGIAFIAWGITLLYLSPMP